MTGNSASKSAFKNIHKIFVVKSLRYYRRLKTEIKGEKMADFLPLSRFYGVAYIVNISSLRVYTSDYVSLNRDKGSTPYISVELALFPGFSAS